MSSDMKVFGRYHDTTNTFYVYKNGQWVVSNTSTEQVGMDAWSNGVRHRRKPSNPMAYPTFFEGKRSVIAAGSGGCQQSLLYRSGTRRYARQAGLRPIQYETSTGHHQMNMAIGKFQESDLAESIATAAQSLNMINKRLGQVLQFVNAVRSGKWDRVASGFRPSRKMQNTPGSKRMANNFLEVQFGWVPLVQSVYDAVSMYQSQTHRGMKIAKRSGGNVEYFKEGSDGFDPSLYGSGAQPLKSVQGSATISGVVSNSRLYDLNRFGLANPALLAWQLVPYSFVVDWFLPISPILGQLTMNLGLSLVIGSRTHVSKSETYAYDQYCRNGGDWLYRQSITWTRFVETPSVIWDMNPISMSIQRAATAAALIRQRMR